jgi:DUF1365 family protein
MDTKMIARGSTLYVGHVSHARLLPFRHSFRYRVFALLLDLDILPTARIFSHNRFNILSFYDRDHGAGDGSPIKDWAMQQLDLQTLVFSKAVGLHLQSAGDILLL